ncbi:MAG: PIN domain-containing protein [Propionibacteriaceae bacterium]|nr:PIN domain-containing protein [Propionibacteriaceae bacterium]
MTLWLLDASVLLATEDSDDDHHGDAVWLLGAEDPLATLDLAFYEVTNVAVRAWGDPVAATRLCDRVVALADDGGLVRADAPLLADAAALATEHGISAYDAGYVAAARRAGARLVSCDLRDLVPRGLAVLPSQARAGRA